jgi:hypothetical protein
MVEICFMDSPRIHFRSDATPEHRERVRVAIVEDRTLRRVSPWVDRIHYSSKLFSHPACDTKWVAWYAADTTPPAWFELCPICHSHLLVLAEQTSEQRAAVVRELSRFPDALACMAVAADRAQHDGQLTSEMIARAVLEAVDYRNPKDVAALAESASEPSLLDVCNSFTTGNKPQP